MGRKQPQQIKVQQPTVIRHEGMEEALRKMRPGFSRRETSLPVEILRIGSGKLAEVDFSDDDRVRLLFRMEASDLVLYTLRLAAMNLRDRVSRCLMQAPPSDQQKDLGPAWMAGGGEKLAFLSDISGVRWLDGLVQITWHQLSDETDKAIAVSLTIDDARKLRDELRRTPEPTNIVRLGGDDLELEELPCQPDGAGHDAGADDQPPGSSAASARAAAASLGAVAIGASARLVRPGANSVQHVDRGVPHERVRVGDPLPLDPLGR